MAKKNGMGWGYRAKVGFHLALIGIPISIIAYIIMLIVAMPFALAYGTTAPPGVITGSLALLTVIEVVIGLLVSGYFLVRFKDWIFANKIF